MQRRAAIAAVVTAATAAARTAAQPQPALDTLQREVWATEIGFARSMAERDFAAFGRYLSEHAVFWSGSKVLRGKAAVLEAWKRFYEGPQAPFSWQPDEVVVLATAAGRSIGRARPGGAS